MPEMLWKKEDLHEVDWVKEQTKSALADLQKEILYTKNGDEVKFDVDTSLDYLKTLKDKKTYKEVMAQNAWATVMAVQILLKNKWYDIGKIDGILKTQWKSTSKTMEAIAKFQSDNWLTPDGAPGPDTIKKILEVYENWWNNWWTEIVEDEEVKDLTEAEFEALCEKTSLTDNEVKQIVKYANKNNNWVNLKNLDELTENWAKELWKLNQYLVLGVVSKLTDSQIFELSKLEELCLSVTEMSDNQMRTLLSNKKTDLRLSSLKKISDQQVKELSKVEWYLQLDWLESLSDDQAKFLSMWNIQRLELYWLTSITDKQAECLANVKKLRISKVILTPNQEQILKKHLSS